MVKIETDGNVISPSKDLAVAPMLVRRERQSAHAGQSQRLQWFATVCKPYLCEWCPGGPPRGVEDLRKGPHGLVDAIE